MPRLGSQLGVCLLLAASLAGSTFAFGQAAVLPEQAPVVRSVQPVQDDSGLAIEILTSRPVQPTIQVLESPPRLVIDLIGASNGVKWKRTPVEGNIISAIRVDQHQASPPVTRVVIDLIAKQGYSWDAAGNRLMVRLRPPTPPEVPTLGVGGKPSVVPVTPGGGNVVLAGGRVSTGSSITAGADTAILHIARGGEVWVCPGSTVSVTTSPNGQDLMLGVSTGAFETHYALGASADSILTPDFRILMPGPGQFDFALSANAQGDTCVRALMGNTASVVVSELMGDRTYQVKPTEQVVFRGGRIEKISNDVPLECGCPPPRPGVMRAGAPVETQLPGHAQLADSGAAVPPKKEAETAALPPSRADEVHMRVEAPLVFRAAEVADSGGAVAAALKISMYPRDLRMKTPALPPAAPATVGGAEPPAPMEAPPKEHKGFFGGIKGFFAAIFR